MTDFETLGAFYLGKRYDLAARARRDDYVLYDAKDLTTHAVIIRGRHVSEETRPKVPQHRNIQSKVLIQVGYG